MNIESIIFRLAQRFRVVIVWRVALCIVALSTGSSSYAMEEADKSKASTDHRMSKASQDLWNLVNGCTHRVTINGSGGIELGIGILHDDGTFVAREFKWNELELFYRKQPDKQIAAVVVDPSPNSKGVLEAAEVIAAKFISIGFLRVVVVQNTGFGYVLLRDKTGNPSSQATNSAPVIGKASSSGKREPANNSSSVPRKPPPGQSSAKPSSAP